MQQPETGNAVAGLPVFSEDTGFLHAPVASFGAPFGCGTISVCVRKRADCVRSVGEQGSVGCMDLPSHSGLPNPSCHGDGGESALALRCLSLHCSCCFQQLSHSFAAVDDGVVDVAAVVSLVTSPAGYPVLRWILQPLHYLLQQWMWHCGYV